MDSKEIVMIWIIEDVLAYSEYPYTEELDDLYKKGIRVILSLVKRDDKVIIEKKGFEYLEVYVRDFTAPTIDQLTKINGFVDSMIEKRKPVLVHCIAGGRSGTVLVSYLISRGKSFNNALLEVRTKIPYAVDVFSQEEMLQLFEMKVRGINYGVTRVFGEEDYFGDIWYFQTDEINNIFRKMAERAEKKIAVDRSRLNRIPLESKVSLGNILEYLRLEIDIDEKLAKEQTTANEVIQKLSLHQKFSIVFEILKREGLYCNLNENLKQKRKMTHYLCFKGEANFSSSEELVVVEGNVENRKFTGFCLRRYFTRISLNTSETPLSVLDLLERKNLDIFCIAAMMAEPKEKEENLILSLICISGDTERLLEGQAETYE